MAATSAARPAVTAATEQLQTEAPELGGFPFINTERNFLEGKREECRGRRQEAASPGWLCSSSHFPIPPAVGRVFILHSDPFILISDKHAKPLQRAADLKVQGDRHLRWV